MNLNYSSAFSFLSFSPCASFLPNYHLHISHQIVFFRRRRSAIITRPLGRPQTAIRRRISPFLSFFRNFHRGNRTNPPRTQIFSNSFPFFLIPPGLLLANKWPPMFLTGPPFYYCRRTQFNLCILLLLIIGGVEVNPSPSVSVNLTFGSLNTRSVVRVFFPRNSSEHKLLHCSRKITWIHLNQSTTVRSRI